MGYDRTRFEGFAVQSETMLQETKSFAGSVNIYEVGEKIGLPAEDCRGIAQYLCELGWARVDWTINPNCLVLTPHGFQEIAKLRRSSWWRWLNTHPAYTAIIASVITMLLGGLLLELLKRNLWP